MAVLKVLHYPDDRLRTIAKPVTTITPEIRQLVTDMLDTMYDENGIGLAATQVNQHLRIVVLDHSEDRSEPMVFINPEIIAHDGETSYEEGCLSVPQNYASVKRAKNITLKAQDIDGNSFELHADGLLAICLQHELDHLIGKLFIDYLSPLKRERIRKKLEKEAKLAERHAL
ncbi:peptide deformylase [Alishewanella sp. 16-MA]|uniref:Peptide deformylase n=1 Tax=Alishewanella maricola TaxID=2795740 RepID=A0ABS8C3P3_9ALTE|nr:MULTISPECIES: peptide deformylase [Alishewanella]MDP4944084.1 peptide deformylase [Alishewanella sp.]MCB5226610.1 peptide deformylase [Alishewanella maricola]MDP5034548.1 peptide deformylase [Alishewanella sp.]MDP5185799.1 peptide deformylase [Alishewanella sp.]MDP5459261.1 peptide deformylase [Alishewanella sp. SMS8]